MSKKLIILLFILFSISASWAQKAPAARTPVTKAPVAKAPVAKAPAAKAPVQKPSAQRGPQVEYGDAPSPNDLPMMNDTWRLIAKKDVKKIGDDKYIAVFPAPLQALNNKTVNLSGYMVPMKVGLTHNHFMMAVLPLAQCQFCGVGGIPDMVEVRMTGAIPYTEDPINIVGKLSLNTDVETSGVFLVDAEEDKQ